jgi:hypothetical protein
MLLLRRIVWLSATLVSCAAIVIAAPPENPEARKIYDHNYQWLENMQINFVAANIRGANDSQYRERRQAALDILRKKHDLTTVPELMDELSRASFLSGEICDVFGEWHTKKALPLLKEVMADSKRPAAVREKAKKAIQAIAATPAEAAPPQY